MTNEFIKAARGSEDSSAERYEKAKKEQAGTDQNPAKKRYQELKEEAKKEFIERQMRKDRDEESVEEQPEEKDIEEEKEDGFVTY